MIKIFCCLITLLAGTGEATAGSPDPLSTLKVGHPRLLATAAEFDGLAKSDDPMRAEVVQRVLATAEAELGDPLLIYKIIPGDAHLLATSRSAFQRIVLFSMAYRLSHDARFADRAKEEIAERVRLPRLVA
jgi:hypothetical protein